MKNFICAVISKSKIQLESKSQPDIHVKHSSMSCNQ